MTTENEKYIMGFNHGYYLKKYKPELLNSLLKSTSQNIYLQGIHDGVKDLDRQTSKSRLNELNKTKNFNRDIHF